MNETDKEYKYRCLCTDILEFFEKATDNFEEFCDCETENGYHKDDCRTINFRLDNAGFEKKIANIRGHKR